MKWTSGIGRRVAVASAFVVGVSAPAVGWHYTKEGWRDRHHNYPPKPHGYQEIVNVFGQPCNEGASMNLMYWRAADDGVYYPVYFHRKLGGNRSSNLNNDVKGHIINAHLSEYVRRGIYGYNCRLKTGGNGWSTHAWGIAVDVSSAWEPYGQCGSTVNYHHAHIWKNHRWKWLRCGDPHHFQYAADY